jgi:hypothetical protein
MDKVTRTRETEKILLLSDLLLGFTIPDLRNKNRIEDYLNILTELNMEEFCLARKIYDQQKNLAFINEKGERDELRQVLNSNWKDLPKITGLEKDIFDYYIIKLENKGILKMLIGYFDSDGNAYRITGFFKKLMQYFEEITEITK